MTKLLQGDDEPLLALEIPLHDIIIGEDDTFRTENASFNDWERRNVIERTRGSIHVRVDLMEVIHGTYENEGDQATLLVFRFRFDPQKHSRRVIRARINIEFFSSNKNGTAPVVDAIAPEERWSVLPTVDNKSTTRAVDLSLGAPSVPFLDAGATLKFEKTINRDISDATTVTGSINLGTGENSGESTVAAWNMQENKRRRTGVPDSVKVAILLRRENNNPFNAKVSLEADADFITGLERKFSKVPLDDPVLFNPTPTGKKPMKSRRYNVQNLCSLDLYSLCHVRMGVEAHFG